MCNLQLYVFLEILGFLIKSSFPEHQRSLASKNLHMFVFCHFQSRNWNENQGPKAIHFSKGLDDAAKLKLLSFADVLLTL